MKNTARKLIVRTFPVLATLAIGLAGCAADVTDDVEVGYEELRQQAEDVASATPLIAGSELEVSYGIMVWSCTKTEEYGWECHCTAQCKF